MLMHVIIGQLSFKQQADTYNYFQKYSGGGGGAAILKGDSFHCTF